MLTEGNGDLRRVTRATCVIAVDMPNVAGIGDSPWQRYITTVDAVEAATDYDLLSNVPEDVQAVIEARRDGGRAPARRGARRRRAPRPPR